MLKNYLKIAFRILRKHSGYSLINIAGLSIGMACSILILMWVTDELGFDKFHENAENLYLVANHMQVGSNTWYTSPPALGPAFKAEYPEIINSARLTDRLRVTLTYNEKMFNESILPVDPALLEMFTFPLVQGSREKALINPHSIVLTEEMAEKYFDEDYLIGKILRINNEYDFMVTGVLKNIPQNSFLKFDFLVPIVFTKEYFHNERHLNIWDNYSFPTYVLLKKNTSIEALNRKIRGRIQQANKKFYGEPFLRPFTQLRLFWLGSGGGTIGLVRAFTLLALFILLMACINFINLTTAQSGNRSREVGIRKVIGAERKCIIQQFWGESIFLSFLSFICAIILVLILLPVFNNLSGKELSLNLFVNPVLIFVVTGVAVFVGIIAGCYPALFMSSFQPIKILKGNLSFGSRGSHLRKILVVIQFAISIALITGATIINNQLSYIRNKDLGFDKEHLIYLPVNGNLRQQYDAAKLEMLQNPNITDVSLISNLPTGSYQNHAGWIWEGKQPNTDPLVTVRYCDYDFLKTFKMEMAQGSFYSEENISETSNIESKIVINEEFARIMEKQNPVGTQLIDGSMKYTVIGVMKDFHFLSLYNDMAPLVILYEPGQYRYMFLRISPYNIPRTIEHMENIWKKFNPNFPFSYTFFDENYDMIYINEERTGSIVKCFTFLAIIISCLGLLGLASYTAEQRKKEISIRKVMGASVYGVIYILSKDFMKWVLLGNIIAWPTAYFVMKNWLQNFAYRTNIGIWIFIFSASSSFIIALMTVCFQAIKAARSNPSKALRYD